AADAPFTLNVPASADGSQPVVLQALIEDASGGATTTAALSIPVAANGAPTGTMAFAAGAPSRIQPGQATTILVHAEDSDGLTKVDLHVTAAGAVTQPEQTKTVSGTAADATFVLTAAAGAAPQTVSVTATLWDKLGSSSTTAPFTFQIVADTGNPVATLTLTPDRGAAGVYRSGESIALNATATDNVAVTALRLVANGVTLASAATSPLSQTWTVPVVTARTPYTLEAVATDGDGNEGRAARTVNVDPVPADLPPAVAFICPATGAVLPNDYTVTLQASATDDLGVTRVRFYLGDATQQFAEVVPAGGSALQVAASATFNLGTVSDSTVSFRVEATDTTGQVSVRQIQVQRTAVVNLKADGQGTNDWNALASQVVALRSGTLTIDQPVTVGGLLVLNGATVTHTATASSTTNPKKVDLTVNGPFYVGCGGVIDVSGRGYPASVTYPGHAAPGSFTAGSHMGEGGVNSPPAGETFGSLYFPQENGSGGWGSRGGGAVRITASRVQVDGTIRANGESTCRSGAGGSVWLRSTTSLAG